MIVDDLFIVDKGNIGRIYWMIRRTNEMSEDKKQEIRQRSIADTLNATLLNAMYDPGNSAQSMDGVIQRGWTEANKQINILEDQTATQSEIFMIGDSSTITRISEIENSTGFISWLNPYLIEEIKRLG
jgi:SOS-response transcriptional repressor LexA